jgi:hypothetical protein
MEAWSVRRARFRNGGGGGNYRKKRTTTLQKPSLSFRENNCRRKRTTNLQKSSISCIVTEILDLRTISTRMQAMRKVVLDKMARKEAKGSWTATPVRIFSGQGRLLL